MRSFLCRAALSIVLAFTLLVCALYPRLIPWVLLGLYLSLPSDAGPGALPSVGPRHSTHGLSPRPRQPRTRPTAAGDGSGASRS